MEQNTLWLHYIPVDLEAKSTGKSAPVDFWQIYLRGTIKSESVDFFRIFSINFFASKLSTLKWWPYLVP